LIVVLVVLNNVPEIELAADPASNPWILAVVGAAHV
jgi:hypothetical protein